MLFELFGGLKEPSSMYWKAEERAVAVVAGGEMKGTVEYQLECN